MDAASRRAMSRTRRFRSRASPMSDRSRSRISTSRSVSRHSHLNSALTDSMISASSLPYDESALVMSPLFRGRSTRNVHARSTSRSPSPSVAPLTPVDAIRGRSLPPPDDDDDGAASSRGRKQYPRDPVNASYTREGLDSVHESIGWDRGGGGGGDRGGGKSGLLSQRVPPRPYFSVNGGQTSGGRNKSVGNVIRAGSTPPGSLLGVPVARVARSRSVGGTMID
jgi:hypothetical protein